MAQSFLEIHLLTPQDTGEYEQKLIFSIEKKSGELIKSAVYTLNGVIIVSCTHSVKALTLEDAVWKSRDLYMSDKKISSAEPLPDGRIMVGTEDGLYMLS